MSGHFNGRCTVLYYYWIPSVRAVFKDFMDINFSNFLVFIYFYISILFGI